ncbi:MAG TPA: GNAT family N-acetyltransferase [Candidatus Omnitrophota bacterium]|nr:GNAT family N-acetyltransferase [Candidatus Omnitrophota bacterium]HPT07836.1 GNAT family N-acetyltransferase [Candidatus Omnitrophota bacterium]
MSKGLLRLVLEPAVIEDAPEILELQKLAYQSEAEIYNDFSLSPLRQTLAEIQKDFETKTFLKAVMNDTIVGSVRAYVRADTCHIGRLIVHPLYQNLGIGQKLLREIESYFGYVKRYELFTSHQSKRNIYFYKKFGYTTFKTEEVSEQRKRLYLEKPAG